MEEKYVLFGAGITGKAAVRYFQKEQIAAVIDNSPVKVGSIFEGIRVISFQEYLEKYKDCKIIICIYSNNYFDVKRQIENEGIFDYFTAPPVVYGFDLPEKLADELITENPQRIVFYDTNPISLRMYEWIKQNDGRECFFIRAFKERQSTETDLPYLFITTEELEKNDTVVITTNEAEEHIRSVLKQVYDGAVFDIYKKNRPMHPELAAFKDKYKGQRCFVIGNGPSLRAEDLDKIRQNHEKSFAANSIHLIYGQTEWRPTYYVVIDRDEEDCKKKWECSDSTPFFADYYYTDVGELEGVNHYSMINQIYGEKEICFSDDITKGLACGRTVTYVMLQMACYMGFSEIYLLGVDFSFGENGGDIYFSKDYLVDEKAEEIQRTLVVLDKEEIHQAYTAARKYAELHNIKIYNATRGGNLDVFERIDFDSLF